MPNRDTIIKLLRFGFVGGLGTLVDACITLSLIYRGMDPLLARVFAIAIAILVTWRLNRAMTFEATSDQSREGARYFIVAGTSMSINYAVYAALIIFVSGIWPLAAIVAATMVSMGVSYMGYNKFAFKPAA